MKKAFILITFLIAYNFSNAQTKGWTEANPDPTLFEKYAFVTEVVSDNKGNIYAICNNTSNGNFVAKWDGSSWSKLGDPNVNDFINTIAIDNSGNVYAAGIFRNQYSQFYVIKWDGVNWTKVGNTSEFLFDDMISSIVVTSTGTLYVSGSFTDVYGFPYITKWDGMKATNIRTDGNVSAIALDKYDSLYIGVHETPLEQTMGKVYIVEMLVGIEWSEIANTVFSQSSINYFNNTIEAIKFDENNNIYVGGSFTNGSGKHFVCKWDKSNWSELGTLDGAIYSMVIENSDNIYAGGNFTNANNYWYVAKWNGSNWSELGAGNNALNANNNIYTMAVDSNGNIFAAGSFTDENQVDFVAEYTDITTTSIIKKKNDNSQVNVYPNPVSGYVNLKCSEKGQLNLINILGETVFSHNVDAGLSYIDLTRFIPGNYILLFNGTNDSHTETLVIK